MPLPLTRESLEENLVAATHSLLALARNRCFTPISANCLFILSEIKNTNGKEYEERSKRTQRNNKIVSKPLTDLLPQLTQLFDAVYDFNLYIYKALQDVTIIEIRYYLKSSLDKDYRKTIAHFDPMLHCKISIPPSLMDSKEKFDINWGHSI